MTGGVAHASTAEQLLEELGVAPDPQLFELALTHRSYAYEHGRIPTNERLEFLGDSVLGVVVTEYIFTTYPDLAEGRLAKLRAAVVSTQALARVARTLGVGELLRLGRGELTTGGRDKDSLLADAMEAIIGAVHVQYGIDGARRFVHHVLDGPIAEAATLGAGLDWKTSVQEMAATLGYDSPVYTASSAGPDHDKRFTAHVSVGDRTFGPGLGRSKKSAEQDAAEIAYRSLLAEHDRLEQQLAQQGVPDRSVGESSGA
ncbi:ribonuclease-3 [Raineyella antarctica]|uniref:Ribonuclease 3 n=1 Tax=Raineyella antarctica TaxID=1577474 RepID=A0A1G6HBW4_9ACTN|nr:ribonuclease III [Raineyella antarctica]SDB91435.1 ribonuclease-3 [Raineyella antarctica]